MKIAIFIWPTLISNDTIQGFLRIRGKEGPDHQADINTLQLLLNDVWTPALQFKISELLRSTFFSYLLPSTVSFLQGLPQNVFLIASPLQLEQKMVFLMDFSRTF